MGNFGTSASVFASFQPIFICVFGSGFKVVCMFHGELFSGNYLCSKKEYRLLHKGSVIYEIQNQFNVLYVTPEIHVQNNLLFCGDSLLMLSPKCLPVENYISFVHFYSFLPIECR